VELRVTQPERSRGGPVVWIVDREHWPRACLRAELIERGYDALGFQMLADALQALAVPAAAPPAATVVDLTDQTGDLDLLARFVRSAGRVVAVAGGAAARSPELRRLPWAAFLARPVSLGALADAVDALLAAAGQADAFRRSSLPSRASS
jgi:hypothetical protein